MTDAKDLQIELLAAEVARLRSINQNIKEDTRSIIGLEYCLSVARNEQDRAFAENRQLKQELQVTQYNFKVCAEENARLQAQRDENRRLLSRALQYACGFRGSWLLQIQPPFTLHGVLDIMIWKSRLRPTTDELSACEKSVLETLAGTMLLPEDFRQLAAEEIRRRNGE